MEQEKINHPKHYNRENGMECIDEMILIFGKEAVMNFCLCNSWKYRYRAADKNGEEDLKKSDWYLQKYKELKESNSNNFTISHVSNISPLYNEKIAQPTMPWYSVQDCGQNTSIKPL